MWGQNNFTAVNIGFNSGNSSYMLPEGLTDTVIDIETTSNVDVAGLYVFRVDQDDIIHPTNSLDNKQNGAELYVFLTVSKPLPLVLGDYVTLSCSHNNSINNQIDYSWYRNNTILLNQTTPTLVLPGVTRRDLGEYRCEVTSFPFKFSATITITARGIQSSVHIKVRAKPVYIG